VGGEVKRVMFEARTLSDLLQLAGVRLYANQRYLETTLEVSNEVSQTLPKSFEHRYTRSGTHGWRRSQSGAGVNWSTVESPLGLVQFHSNPAAPFATRSNGETRNRTEHLGFLGNAGPLVEALNHLAKFVGKETDFIISPPAQNALTSGIGWNAQGQMWQGVDTGLLDKIPGLLNISASQFGLPTDALAKVKKILQNPAGTALDLPNLFSSIDMAPLIAANGVSIGINAGGNVGANGVGGSLGGSVSTSQLLPTATRTSATGATGSISHQATRTGSSYAQSLNDGWDESESYTDYRGGIHRRQVNRALLQPGTVRRRTPNVQVQWQEQVMDVVVGSVPLQLNLPALADKVYDQRDEWLRVRFGNGMRDGWREQAPQHPSSGVNDLVMDVWFDLQEEVVRDDY
jgi:hypothetical protein